MSHVNAIQPVGTPSTAPGATNIYRVLADVPADAVYEATATGSDGSTALLSANVDRPSLALEFATGNPVAPHKVYVTVTGGTLAAVAGQPDQFAWTLPS